MDALGVPLEEETAAEVKNAIERSGWTPGKHMRGPVAAGAPPGVDSLTTKLGLIRHAPAAMMLDRIWTEGVPDRWPAVGEYLKERTGHTFPVLSHLRHRRAVRAIATIITENLGESVILREKLAAGLIYANTIGNSSLTEELRVLGAEELPESPMLTLARAISSSPAVLDGAVLEAARTIPAARIVELVSFIATLQLLHRLSTYYSSPA